MTLLECCVVVAIILLVGSMGTRLFIAQQRWAVRFATQQLYSVVVYAQRKAMATGMQERIIFEEHAYLFEGKRQQLPQGVRLGYCKNAWGPPAQPVYEINKSVTFIDRAIVCSPDGTVSAGTIYLSDSRSRYFFALTSGIAGTLYLRIYEYNVHKHLWQKQTV